MSIYPNPFLTSEDSRNMQTAYADVGLDQPVTISFLLYGMKRRAWKHFSKQLVSSGLTQYTTHDYDGFTFYMTMTFTKLVNNGDSIGIEMPLPNDVEDRIVGWGLYYESFSQTYTPAPYIRDRAGNG